MIRFFLALLAVAALLALLCYAAAGLHIIHGMPSFFVTTLVFTTLTTALLYSYLVKRAAPGFFVPMYLLTMVVKLLGGGVYAYILITTDKAGTAANVVFFLLAYMTFTALEIVFLHRYINR